LDQSDKTLTEISKKTLIENVKLVYGLRRFVVPI